VCPRARPAASARRGPRGVCRHATAHARVAGRGDARGRQVRGGIPVLLAAPGDRGTRIRALCSGHSLVRPVVAVTSGGCAGGRAAARAMDVVRRPGGLNTAGEERGEHLNMALRLARNKLVLVLALGALAIVALGAASAAFGGIGNGGVVSNFTQPREGAELVDGYVAWEVRDADGALVATGGRANEITQASLDYLLGRVGTGGQYTHIGILQGASCALAD